ncbi:MAG: PAS domain S-box protein, partial [Methanospirillum sp.]|nr:PAS domain S-box protein [Methanospirillum sp.]
SYDAIISDYTIPEMNGIELLREVRRSYGTIPFILFTGKEQEEVLIDALNHGADYYLHKDRERESLCTELARVIRHVVERQLPDKSHAESDETSAGIIEDLPEPTFVIDTKGIIIVWNRAIRDMTGIEPERIIGRGDFEHSFLLLGKRTPMAIDCILDPSLILEGNHRVITQRSGLIIEEWEGNLKDGRNVVFRMKATPLYDKDGAISGAIETIQDITEEKEQQAEYEKNQLKYQSVFESANVGLFQTNPEGTSIMVNPTFARMFGYSSPEEMNREVSDIAGQIYVYPGDRSAFKEAVHKSGKVRNREIFFKRKDGTSFWGSLNANAIHDNDNTIIAYYGTVIDITSQKQATEDLLVKNEQLAHLNEELLTSEEEIRNNMEELTRQSEALKESEERFRRIVETALEGVWSIDRNFNTTYVNLQMAEMLGYEPEELLGRPIHEFMHHQEHASNIQQLNERKNGKSGRYERILIRKDGTSRTFLVSARPVFLPDGTFDGSFAMLSDITDLKMQEKKLKESEEHFRTVIEKTPVPMFLSKNTRLIFVNDAFLKMTGFSTDELSLMNIQDLVPPDFRENTRERNDRREKGENVTSSYDGTGIKKDGSEYPSHIDIALLYLPDGPVTLAYITDLTYIAQKESALKTALRNLSLLSGVTRHDILNSLLTLDGYLDLIEMDSTEEVIKKWVSLAKKASGTIQRKILFTRTYEKIGAANPQWQNISEIISQVPRPDIGFCSACTGYLVYADPMLVQVLENLLDNSMRHGEKVTEIRISCKETSSGLTIIYEDNGCGIPYTDKEKIFERGYGKNTGYGLFLIQEILAITGLTITECGKPGEGARFEITIPKGAFQKTGIKPEYPPGIDTYLHDSSRI